jgi:hypothetical protein
MNELALIRVSASFLGNKMKLTQIELFDLIELWKTGTWYERLAYYLISKNKFKCIYDSAPEKNVYLVRMYIFGTSKSAFSLWLHFFPRGDEDRALHSHPFPFLSYVVAGSYIEELLRGWKIRKKHSVVFRSTDHLHRVHTNYAWTLILRGPKVKDWGFLVCGKMIPWRKFLGLPETVEDI